MPIYTDHPCDDGFFPMERHPLRSSIGIGPKVTKIIDAATKDWLDKHPEATTTVEEESLEERHLKPSLSLELCRCFDVVADMQTATDLKIGMTCHTNGFHSVGDNGAAFYRVTADDEPNGMDVLALQDGLRATLVVTESYVTPEQFGAYGDGTHDDAAAINRALNINKRVFLHGKIYLTLDSVIVNSGNELFGTQGSTILNGINNGPKKTVIVGGDIRGNLVPGASSPVSRPRGMVVFIADNKVELSAQPDYKVGDAVIVMTLDNDNLPVNVDFGLVTNVNGTMVTLDNDITNKGLFDAIDSSVPVYIVDVSTPIQDSLDYYDASMLVHDVHIHDITLEMLYPVTGSGMYAIAACGYDWRIDNIYFKNVTTPIGSNIFCRGKVTNCKIKHTGGLADFADLCINTLFENIDYERVGKNANHYSEGFSCHGYLVTLRHVHVNNAPYLGGFRMQYCSAAYLDDCSIDTGSFVTSSANSVAFYFATSNSGFLRSTMRNCIIKSNATGVFGIVDMYDCEYIGNGDYSIQGNWSVKMHDCMTNGNKLCNITADVASGFIADTSNGIKGVRYKESTLSTRNAMGEIVTNIYPTYEVNGKQGIRFMVTSACDVAVKLGNTLLTTISAAANVPVSIYLTFVHTSSMEYVSIIVENGANARAIYNTSLPNVDYTNKVPITLTPTASSGYIWVIDAFGYLAN